MRGELPQLGLKAYLEESLALSWGVALTGIRTPAEIRIDYAEIAIAILKTGVGSADLHAVEDIEKLHPQLGLHSLPKVKSLCQA